MPLAPGLLEAYRRADYVVFGEPELVLKIGERNPELDELLRAESATTAAFVTGANPRGERTEAWENQVAAAALHESQAQKGYACYSGEGRDPDGQWPAEQSVLVVGISRPDAEELGRAFEQNAIVFAERGKAPELVVLEG